jgi:hypothetical protein
MLAVFYDRELLKYCHRLEGQQEGLLFDAYICNKELHFSKINTWYSSILYIIDELKVWLVEKKFSKQ